MATNAYAVKTKKGNGAGARLKTITASACATILLLFLFALRSQAYTTVVVSTGTSESVEQALLAQISAQFNASLIVNPLVPNTFQVKLFGLNPNYQPVTPPPLITLDGITKQLTAISTYTYVTGFATGMTYERTNNAETLGYFMGLCNGATNFNLIKIDSTTCQGVLGFMDNWIITQSSGLAVVPNPPPGF